jgi:endonuclease/exonuclease/phosphatase family metal-dependent hydrolase
MERNPKKMVSLLIRAVAVALLGVGVPALCPHSARAGEAPPASSERFRVLSYNVWGLPGVLLQKGRRIPLIPREISRIDADVVAFQETFHASTRRLMSIPGYPFVAVGPGKSAGRTSSGLMIASKWPIVRSEKMVFDRCSGTDCLANKGALLTRLDVDGVGEVDVVATHLNAAGGDSLRSQQLAQILELVARESGDRPVILAGDFNFHSESDPYYDLSVDEGYRDSFAEYRDARPELSPMEWFGFTFDPDRNLNLKLEAPFRRGDRLDYIWVKDHGRTETRVKRSGLVLDRQVSGMHLSDHFGVRTDFEILPVSSDQ